MKGQIKKYSMAIIIALLTFLPAIIIYRGMLYILLHTDNCYCLQQFDATCDCLVPGGNLWPMVLAIITCMGVFLFGIKCKNTKMIRNAFLIILLIYVVSSILILF